MKPRYMLRLDSYVFGAQTSCDGWQLAAILSCINKVRANLVWYAADVQTVGPPLFGYESRTPALVGASAVIIESIERVTQFDTAVFAGVPGDCNSPVFRPDGLWMDDEEDADLGDAVVEVRAFDTSYMSVATSDKDIADQVMQTFKGTNFQTSAPPT